MSASSGDSIKTTTPSTSLVSTLTSTRDQLVKELAAEISSNASILRHLIKAKVRKSLLHSRRDQTSAAPQRTPEAEFTTISVLPDEIWLLILEHLNTTLDLRCFACTARDARRLAYDHKLWARLKVRHPYTFSETPFVYLAAQDCSIPLGALPLVWHDSLCYSANRTPTIQLLHQDLTTTTLTTGHIYCYCLYFDSLACAQRSVFFEGIKLLDAEGHILLTLNKNLFDPTNRAWPPLNIFTWGARLCILAQTGLLAIDQMCNREELLIGTDLWAADALNDQTVIAMDGCTLHIIDKRLDTKTDIRLPQKPTLAPYYWPEYSLVVCCCFSVMHIVPVGRKGVEGASSEPTEVFIKRGLADITSITSWNGLLFTGHKDGRVCAWSIEPNGGMVMTWRTAYPYVERLLVWDGMLVASSSRQISLWSDRGELVYAHELSPGRAFVWAGVWKDKLVGWSVDDFLYRNPNVTVLIWATLHRPWRLCEEAAEQSLSPTKRSRLRWAR